MSIDKKGTIETSHANSYYSILYTIYEYTIVSYEICNKKWTNV